MGVTLFEFQCPLQFILRFIRSSVTIDLTASAYRIIHQISVICLQMIVMFTLRLAAAVKQICFKHFQVSVVVGLAIYSTL